MTDELDEEDDGVVHVESGSFRVDRRRALDKLMRFQLPQAEMFMLPWVRCAVAGGATYVKLAPAQDALELRFDGRPFARQELADPYSCLFDKHKPENRRNRELAIGLLSVLRLKPQFVTLNSGAPGSRARLRVESLESEQVDPSEDPSPDTVIKVVPGPATPGLWDPERAEWVESLCRVCRVPIWLSGLEAARVKIPPHPPGHYFEDKEVRSWLTVPAEPAAVSTFQAYALGVFVAPTQAPLPRVQVEGYIDDDQFTLSASQTAVARNARFRRTLELVAANSEKLLQTVAEGHRERMEAAAKASILGDLLYYWRNRLERGPAAENPSPLEGAKESVKGALKLLAGVDLKKREEDIADIYWTARATVWLRDAASRLLQDADTDMKDPLLAALWSAPVEFGISGTALSLLDLEIQRRRLGYIPVSQKPSSRLLPFEAVWVTSARDVEVLVRRFPDLIRDVTDQLDALSAAQSHAPTGRVSLELAGIADVLVRDAFGGEGVRGEIGLALLPHERGARVSVIKDGAPSSFAELPSDLRFDAALETVREDLGPRAQEALAEAAKKLYPKLLAEYDCWKAGDRTQAIRDHLLDFLLVERAEAATLETSPPGLAPKPSSSGAVPGEISEPGPVPGDWIETVPLFDFVDSWLDFQRLRAAVAEGRPVYLAPERSTSLQWPGKLVMVGRRLTEAALKRLLPDSMVMDVAGKSGLRVLVSAPPKLECSHAGPCLAERALGSNVVHLAVGPGVGQELRLPWGRVRVFAPGPLSPEEVDSLAQDYRLLIDLVSATLKRRGTGLGDGSDEERGILLDALEHLLAPWPGRGPARPRQNLIEFLDTMPLFRQPAGAGWTVGQVAARLGAALDVTYIDPSEAAAAASADLVLDERELAFLRNLFPGWQKRLVNAVDAGPTAAPRESPPAEAAPATTPPPAEYIPPPHLTFDEPMLFARLYRENGLSARLGLPVKPGRPALAVFRNGKPVELPKVPQFVGAMRLEMGGWQGKGAPEAETLRALLHRFYLDLADHWPVADPSSPLHASAVEQVLRVLQLSREPGTPERQAAEERARLGGLKMFRTLAGGFASLAELKALAQDGDVLPYAEREFLPVPESAAPVPVLPLGLAKLLGTLLDLKPQGVKPPPKPKLEPAAEPAAAADGRPEAEAVVRARYMLRHLRGRRGLKVRSAALVVAEEADPTAPLVTVEPGGSWVLQPYHPAVMAILGSSLSPDEQGAYLASLIYTAANRLLDDVTDKDDAKFQQALADFIASPGPAAEPQEQPE